MKARAVIEKSTAKRHKALEALLGKQRGQTLLLLPEVHMLDTYTGKGTVFHAGLSASRKKEIWNGVASGEIQHIVGTQKALFLPFKNLGAIVIDEEQSESYKLWSQYPRLHTVRAAQRLASLTKAKLIYGSSYPSIRLRYAIAQGECTEQGNNPVRIMPKIVSFSFEDRKWKRPIPDEASRDIRRWAATGKKVLVFYNKKDNAALKKGLLGRLSVAAKKNITIATAAILAQTQEGSYDYVVWVSPELSMRVLDYRANERTRILAARLQNIAPQKNLLCVTRYADIVRSLLDVSDTQWEEKTLHERKLLFFPPFSDIVRCTVRDRSAAKALARATDVMGMMQKQLGSSAQVFGPLSEKGAKKKNAEYYIVAMGPLEVLADAYKDLPIDGVDVDPNIIV